MMIIMYERKMSIRISGNNGLVSDFMSAHEWYALCVLHIMRTTTHWTNENVFAWDVVFSFVFTSSTITTCIAITTDSIITSANVSLHHNGQSDANHVFRFRTTHRMLFGRLMLLRLCLTFVYWRVWISLVKSIIVKSRIRIQLSNWWWMTFYRYLP